MNGAGDYGLKLFFYLFDSSFILNISTVTTTAGMEFAVCFYRNNEILGQIWYQDERELRFSDDDDGFYHCTVFVKKKEEDFEKAVILNTEKIICDNSESKLYRDMFDLVVTCKGV